MVPFRTINDQKEVKSLSEANWVVLRKQLQFTNHLAGLIIGLIVIFKTRKV